MKTLLPVALVCFLLASCNFRNEKCITTKKYTGNAKLKSVYVIVADDKDTREWLTIYKNAFIDSLKSNHLEVEGISYSSGNKKAEIKDIISSHPSASKFQNVLYIAVAKTTAGYGTKITRHLHIDLFDVNNGKKIWNGTLTSTNDWYISAEEYKAIAQKLTHSTLVELKNNTIL